MEIEDVLRSLVLAELITTFVFAYLILFHYALRQYREKQLKTHLTWHVVTMLVVFLGICGYCFADILLRFGTPTTWRSFVLVPLFAFAIVGEVFMLRYQLRRS